MLQPWSKKLQRAKGAEWWTVYTQYLRSEKWKRKRLRVLQRDGFRCRLCKQRKATTVHHLTYSRVGREWLRDLISVCSLCHSQKHTKPRR